MDPKDQNYYDYPSQETVVFKPTSPDEKLKIVNVCNAHGGPAIGLYSLRSEKFSQPENDCVYVVAKIP